MIHPIGLVDILPELPQMSLLLSVKLCPKYVCVSSCSHYRLFEASAFPIARHTQQCIAIQWNLVGKVRVHVLAQDRGLVPDHGLVLEISGYLFKSVIFHKCN